MAYIFAITATLLLQQNDCSDSPEITMPKRPLAPAFINKLDDYLLENRPDTWSTRIHLIIYYWLLFSLALGGLSFIVPDNPLERSTIEYWIAAQTILVIVALVVWLVFLLRFNTFKSFGTVYHGDRIKTFFFFFLTMVLFVSTVFIAPMAETYKTMIRYSTNQVSDDMNRMNLALASILKKDYPAEITVDTIYILDYSTFVPPTTSDVYTFDDSTGTYIKEPLYLSREELRWTIGEEDSIVWVSNDKLIRYMVSNLQFVSDYNIKQHSNVKILRNFDIYNTVYGSSVPVDKAQMERDFYAIAEKYRTPGYTDGDYWMYSNGTPQEIAVGKYGVYEINYAIGNVGDRLFRFEEMEFGIILRIIFYVSLFVALLIYAFRHSTIRTFFLTFLFAILLAIISGIVMAMLRFDEWAAMLTVAVYYSFFFIFAIATIRQKVRSVFSGIALNMTLVLTPFIPVLLVAAYYIFQARNSIYDDMANIVNQNYMQPPDRSSELLHTALAEVFGFVILLILIETVFKWMYRTWYAAPEE